MTEQLAKCPFLWWRKPVASILPTVTAPVSFEQSAAITTPEQDVTPAAIESPEGNAVPTTTTPSDKVDASATWKEFWKRLLAKSRLLGLWETPTCTPSTEEVGAWQTLEELWGKLLTPDLGGEKLDFSFGLLGYGSCKDDILRLYKAYKERADTKFLTAMKPVVEGLLVFSPGITSLAKANKVLPLVWGGIQIFLEVSVVPAALS